MNGLGSKSKGGIVIRKTVRLMMCIVFSIVVLAGCAKPVEVVSLPPPTGTPTPPMQIFEPSPTAFSMNEAPMIERVSVASDGTQGNADSYAPSISADGRYVTFSSIIHLVEVTRMKHQHFCTRRVTGESTSPVAMIFTQDTI
jgi:uncharacterized lipoprotein YajG